jgi:hypothetical protein
MARCSWTKLRERAASACSDRRQVEALLVLRDRLGIAVERGVPEVDSISDTTNWLTFISAATCAWVR